MFPMERDAKKVAGVRTHTSFGSGQQRGYAVFGSVVARQRYIALLQQRDRAQQGP